VIVHGKELSDMAFECRDALGSLDKDIALPSGVLLSIVGARTHLKYASFANIIVQVAVAKYESTSLLDSNFHPLPLLISQLSPRCTHNAHGEYSQNCRLIQSYF